jgi:hypothetical protein
MRGEFFRGKRPFSARIKSLTRAQILSRTAIPSSCVERVFSRAPVRITPPSGGSLGASRESGALAHGCPSQPKTEDLSPAAALIARKMIAAERRLVRGKAIKIIKAITA